MKTIKPLTLSVLHRVVEHAGKLRFAVTGLVLVPLDDGTPHPLSEQLLWQTVPGELGAGGVVDEGWPKAKAEVLLSGSAFVPKGRADVACEVRLRFGKRDGKAQIDKVVRVIGDRTWDAMGSATAPTPFTEMPLGYERAFGGEGFADNPVGRGAATPSGGPRVLPNVEDPRQPLRSPNDRPAPAGFGPYGAAWPQRAKDLGTYDARWLKEEAPGFARDMDWSTFNAAPADQQLDGFLSGDETYRLENVHPTEPVLEGSLPGLVVRFFVNRRPTAGGEEELTDIATRLDTVHFVPRLRAAVLVYRGVTDVREDDADDILQLVGAIERKSEPRPVEHYARVLRERLDPQKGARYAFRERDLTPAGAPSVFASLLPPGPPREGLLEARARVRAQRELDASRQRLAERGIDPDKHLPKKLPEPEPVPALEDLPETMEANAALVATERANAEERRKEAEGKARELAKKAGLDFDKMREDATSKKREPPQLTVDAKLVMARAQLAALAARGANVAAFQAKLDDPAFRAQLEAARVRTAEAYRLSAHHMPAGLPLDPANQNGLQRDFDGRLGSGEGFAGIDLYGVDLSGRDLSGVDFSEALMEGAILKGARLVGANFEKAVLARADLREADLTGARFGSANLGGADLRGAKAAEGLDLSRATLWETDLSGASFTGAKLDDVTVFEVKLAGAQLPGLSATKASFYKTDLTGMVLTGATLEGCTFMECTLTGADLSRARLGKTCLVQCNADGANLGAAEAANLRVVHGSSMKGASFIEARLVGANLRGTCLENAVFSAATLDRADFSDCNLRGATFYRVAAREARFIRADLTGSVLLQAGLLGAILQKATIEGADFTSANLFGSDLARVRGKPKTMDDAELGRARVIERRSP